MRKVVFTQNDAFDDMTGWLYTALDRSQCPEEFDMEPVIIELKPGVSSKEIAPHEGEEMGYVLSGRILLIRESNRKGLPLKKGDTFYIKGNESHHLENRSQKTATVLWISTPPEF
jgi:uncharacterized cupin superfamily protein